MTEIEPCPNPVCQCKDVQVNSGGPGCHYVKCRGCGLQTDDGCRDRQVALWNSLPRTPTAPSGDEVERVAQWLHDEGGFDEAWQATWPEHPDDTGRREGGFVRIVPSDVCAKFRDVARRLLVTHPAAIAAMRPASIDP